MTNLKNDQSDAPEATTGDGNGTLKLAPRRALLTAASVAAALTLVAAFGASRSIEATLAEPLAFRIRSVLGKDPKLAPNIKIVTVDDRAITVLRRGEPSLAAWTEVVAALAARGPKRIVIDETFAQPFDAVEAQTFVATLRDTGVPVIAKATAQDERIAGRPELLAQKRAISLTKLLTDSLSQRQQPTWLPGHPYFVYGPSPEVEGAFTEIGHDLGFSDGALEPLVSVGSSLFLPHWSLFAAGDPRVVEGRLEVGGHVVPVDGDGRVPVNFLSRVSISGRLLSLADVLAASRAGKPVQEINAGDTVVLLPDLHVGSVAFEDTAAGRLPLAFIHLAMVHSAITGEWLERLPGGMGLIALLSLAGAALALCHQRKTLPWLLCGAGVSLFGISTLAFLAFDLLVPWVMPLLALMVTGFMCNHVIVKLAEQRAALLRHDLHGILSPETLQRLGPQGLHHLEATEQIVTIMFIDIVGFSRAAEKQTPKEAFSSLKTLVDHLRRTVHAFGGVVDRTMGDGMLCVFGYDFEGKGQAAEVHALAATQCAAKIQHDNLKRMVRAHKTNQAVFPLRVGINTTGVYLGNLGDTERTDLTVIGNGVNFAQRLEAACDRHMAMLGASTRDLIPHLVGDDVAMRKRHIRVKHSEALVEAYELDPFHAEPQLLLDGDEAYRQFTGIERNDVRNPVPYPGLIRVMTNFGDGEMINYSFDGFTIKLSEYYAKDVAVSLRMDTADGALGEQLERAGLANLMLEIRWARPVDDGFIHGCLIKNLSKEQRDNAIQLLRDVIKRYAAKERRAA